MLHIRVYMYIFYVYIQALLGVIFHNSGELSLRSIILIYPKISLTEFEKLPS